MWMLSESCGGASAPVDGMFRIHVSKSSRFTRKALARFHAGGERHMFLVPLRNPRVAKRSVQLSPGGGDLVAVRLSK